MPVSEHSQVFLLLLLFVRLFLDIPNVENIHSGLLSHLYEIATQQALV